MNWLKVMTRVSLSNTLHKPQQHRHCLLTADSSEHVLVLHGLSQRSYCSESWLLSYCFSWGCSSGTKWRMLPQLCLRLIGNTQGECDTKQPRPDRHRRFYPQAPSLYQTLAHHKALLPVVNSGMQSNVSCPVSMLSWAWWLMQVMCIDEQLLVFLCFILDCFYLFILNMTWTTDKSWMFPLEKNPTTNMVLFPVVSPTHCLARSFTVAKVWPLHWINRDWWGTSFTSWFSCCYCCKEVKVEFVSGVILQYRTVFFKVRAL